MLKGMNSVAETLHQVFCIFVRPTYQEDSTGNRVPYTGVIYRIKGYVETKYCYYPILQSLSTENIGSTNLSSEFINSSNTYYRDAWFLHSSYTSYWKCRDKLKELMKKYGKENLKLFIYIPWDYEVTPD